MAGGDDSVIMTSLEKEAASGGEDEQHPAAAAGLDDMGMSVSEMDAKDVQQPESTAAHG